jgi:hypothetical protein
VAIRDHPRQEVQKLHSRVLKRHGGLGIWQEGDRMRFREQVAGRLPKRLQVQRAAPFEPKLAQSWPKEMMPRAPRALRGLGYRQGALRSEADLTGASGPFPANGPRGRRTRARRIPAPYAA